METNSEDRPKDYIDQQAELEAQRAEELTRTQALEDRFWNTYDRAQQGKRQSY